MRSTNSFNKLWIIESLKNGELKTGTRLFEDLFPKIQKQYPVLTVVHVQPTSKPDLLRCLDDIYRDVAEHKNFPLIHFECHGCEEGLEVASRELVKWNEIREALIKINFACELNLLVVVAACKGAYLVNVATQLDRAPFYAMVGSKEEMNAGEVQADFLVFYEAFFRTLSGNVAIRSLNEQAARTNRSYYFIGSEIIFLRAFRTYHQTHCIGRAKQERIEALLTKSLQDPNVRARGVNWARSQAKKWFRMEQKPEFDKMKARFFGLQEYPQNAERFTVNYDHVCREWP